MKVIIHGALGRMGIALTELVCSGKENAVLAAMVDKNAAPSDNLFTRLEDYDGSADVIIDFSHHTAVTSLLPYAVERDIPVVIATTGHDEAEKEEIHRAATHIPIFLSANMSLGIAALVAFAQCAARMFPEADIEIVETHHTGKLDAPSGTALLLAEGIRKERPQAVIHCGRVGMGKRDPNEIGISSLRLGRVVGIHEVIITTGTETLTLKHEAHDRSLFAQGALAAAAYLCGKPAGLYSVNDMVRI